MTASKPSRTCPECVHDGGWHWTDDLEPRAYRCPNYRAAELHEQAQKLTKEASEQAKEAAHRIVADAAETMREFSANELHDAFEASQVPESARGGAFNWARENGLIVKTARRVMSRKATTRRDLPVWRSLVYGKRRGSAA